MAIIIVTTAVPFLQDDGKLISAWLHAHLKQRNHQAELLELPFEPSIENMAQQMLALRLLDIEHYADLVIAIGTPSYFIHHPNKVIWFTHHHRCAYDLWGTEYEDSPNSDMGKIYRSLFRRADNNSLREAQKIYTNSQMVSDRLKVFNEIESEVLYPPLFSSDHFLKNDWGDYIYFPGIISEHKRQLLAVEAMQHVKTDVKLVIAGIPASATYTSRVEAEIKNGLEDKIKLVPRWITEEEKVDFLTHALACTVLTSDGNSDSYIGLEAHHSRNAIVTCCDSGGITQLVNDGDSGYVVPPDPKAIAKKFDELYRNKALARKMGERGNRNLETMNISWDNVIDKLLS